MIGPPALKPKSLICWILLVLRTPFARSSSVRFVALEEVVGQVEPAGQARPVAAAPGDHVQGDAARLNGDVGRAARRHVQLFEHVEVVVEGRAAEGRRVGDVDAVDRPDVVGALVAAHAAGRVALGHEARLLAGLVAADVLAVDHDRGSQLQDDPRVAGRRQGLHGFLVDVLPDRRLLDVDDGGLGDDRDLLFEGPDLEDQIDLSVGADVDDDARLGRGLESRQLGPDLIGGGRERHEPEDARFPADRREACHLRSRQLDAHAGQGVPFRVGDLPVDVSGSDLRRQRHREQQQGENDEKLLHESYLLSIIHNLRSSGPPLTSFPIQECPRSLPPPIFLGIMIVLAT